MRHRLSRLSCAHLSVLATLSAISDPDLLGAQIAPGPSEMSPACQAALTADHRDPASPEGRAHSPLPPTTDQPPTYSIHQPSAAVTQDMLEDLRAGCFESALHHLFGVTRRPWFPAFAVFFPASPDTALTIILKDRKVDWDLTGEDYIWVFVFSEGRLPTFLRSSPAPADSSAPASTSAQQAAESPTPFVGGEARLQLRPTSRHKEHVLRSLLPLVLGRAAPDPIGGEAAMDTDTLDLRLLGVSGNDSLFASIHQVALEDDVDYQVSVSPAQRGDSIPQAYTWFRNTSRSSIALALAAGALEGSKKAGLFLHADLRLYQGGGDPFSGDWPWNLSATVGTSLKGSSGLEIGSEAIWGVTLGNLWNGVGLTVGRSLARRSDGSAVKARWYSAFRVAL